MKKLKVLGLAAAAAGMVLLTSCLKGNNMQDGVAYGVIGTMEPTYATVAYIDDVTPFYSTAFSSLMPDQCVVFRYSIDYDAPENKGGNKYITATVPECIKMTTLSASPVLDTVLVKNELTISDVQLAWNMIKGHIFVSTTHPAVSKDQTNRYEMFYDVSNPVVDNGERIYDLYIRSIKEKEGNSVAAAGSMINAFNVKYFITQASQREKADGKKELKFRFKYYKEFDKDTTQGTWATSQSIIYPIADSSSN